MYRFRIKIAGKLNELLTDGKGFLVHKNERNFCVFRSLADAQYLVKVLAGYSLLSLVQRPNAFGDLHEKRRRLVYAWRLLETVVVVLFRTL